MGGGLREMGWGGLYKDREAGGGGRGGRQRRDRGRSDKTEKGWCKEQGDRRTDRRQAEEGSDSRQGLQIGWGGRQTG